MYSLGFKLLVGQNKRSGNVNYDLDRSTMSFNLLFPAHEYI